MFLFFDLLGSITITMSYVVLLTGQSCCASAYIALGGPDHETHPGCHWVAVCKIYMTFPPPLHFPVG